LDSAIHHRRLDVVKYYIDEFKFKPKMYALCMGWHPRLGANSPLRLLCVDVMAEISKHFANHLREQHKKKTRKVE
jgi:hypothetical protein